MNLLMERGGLIGRNETHTVLYSQPDMAPEILDQTAYNESIVVQLADEHGAQFVLSGVIRDLEIESTEYIRGSGVFSRIKSMMRDYVARRGIGIDVYIHDGVSGGWWWDGLAPDQREGRRAEGSATRREQCKILFEIMAIAADLADRAAVKASRLKVDRLKLARNPKVGET